MMKSIAAWGLIGFGAFLSLGEFMNVSKGKFDASDIVAWALFGIAPILGGGLLLRSRAVEKNERSNSRNNRVTRCKKKKFSA